MKNLPAIILLLLLHFSKITSAQKPEVTILHTGYKTSLRGLSVVNDNVIWVSGSNGTVGKSYNAGKNWKWITVKGFEKTEFRDIEAFDATTAVIMAVGEPAYILKTIDGGENWKIVFENKTKGMFLDAMEFWHEKAGIVVGDPVNGRFYVGRTFDGGSTWQDIPFDKRPAADSGEACFAASGTNVRALDSDEAIFVSGGITSKLHRRETSTVLPVIQGKETTGANSIAVYDNRKKNGGNRMIVVGGDFNNDTSTIKNCFYSNDRGKTWKAPLVPPGGYRSCVEYLSKDDVLTCGLTGVDYSNNGGKTWEMISKEGFNVCRIAKKGPAIFLAGNNGKIARIIWK